MPASPSRTPAPGLGDGRQFDATGDGRQLKFLNAIDEHSCLCLAIRVGRRCKAKDVVAVLEELTSIHPVPAFIRSNNGPDFIVHALRRWCQNSGTATAYIEAGSPWQNCFAASFKTQFRVEFLNTELFATVAVDQGLSNRWRREYDTLRPHSALQGRTPLGGSSSSCCMTTHSHCSSTNEGVHVMILCTVSRPCGWHEYSVQGQLICPECVVSPPCSSKPCVSGLSANNALSTKGTADKQGLTRHNQ
jgi:putative transposase